MVGAPDCRVILHPRNLLGVWTGFTSFAVTSTQFLPQTGRALTPVQLSASHIQCLSLGKATSGVPTLKTEIPISSTRLDMFTANGSYISVPTANRPHWLTQMQTIILALQLVKSELGNQSFHIFPFFPAPRIKSMDIKYEYIYGEGLVKY